MHALSLAERRDPNKLVAYSLHPGVVATKLLRRASGRCKGPASSRARARSCASPAATRRRRAVGHATSTTASRRRRRRGARCDGARPRCGTRRCGSRSCSEPTRATTTRGGRGADCRRRRSRGHTRLRARVGWPRGKELPELGVDRLLGTLAERRGAAARRARARGRRAIRTAPIGCTTSATR